MFGDDCVCGGGGGGRGGGGGEPGGREGGRPNPLFSRCVHVKDFRARGGAGGGGGGYSCSVKD